MSNQSPSMRSLSSPKIRSPSCPKPNTPTTPPIASPRKRGRSVTTIKKMTWWRRNRIRQSMHKTPPKRSQVRSIDCQHGQLNK